MNLIPMAGRGDRFARAGYRVPKPFVPVGGEPMFLFSARTLPPASRHLFVCRAEHLHSRDVEALARRHDPESRVLAVERATEGQACTCLLAADELDPDAGLLIASCDYQTVYDRDRYARLCSDPGVDVIVWTFRFGAVPMPDPGMFAYGRLEGDRVVEIVEKRTISDRPRLDPMLVGTFTFRSAGLFIRAATRMIERDIRVNGEFYVGTSINQLIEEGLRVVNFEVSQYISFGSPEELRRFQFWDAHFASLEEHPHAGRGVAGA